MRRVVVTGLGIVSPLGRGVDYNWESLLAGKSGIRRIQGIDLKDIPVLIAGQVPYGEGEHEFNPDTVMAPKDQKKADRFILFGVAAANDALKDANYEPKELSEEEQCRAGVMMGSGIGGLNTIYENAISFDNVGIKRISPFFIPSCLINLISGTVSIDHGLKGPNHACVTACSTGTHAIGDAARIIAMGDADVMVAGGAESAVNVLGLAGFARMHAVTSAFNDEPEKASRPWDKNRDGFVMSEGSGVIVLEEYEHAKARGAHIYAEVIGYGMSGDAYHMTAPASDGNGAKRAMLAALKSANIKPEEVDYINAHGTSTMGDMLEFNAVKEVFAPALGKISMSSTKSATGHLLGAAGAVETIFCTLALRDQIMPPTLNLDDPEEGTECIDLVPHTPKKKDLNIVLSNSFGFGGTNACVILKKTV